MTKILFDTSALIAAIIEIHPKHKSALTWLNRAKEKEFELIVSAHSLLEVYSVLTTASFKPLISPANAMRLINKSIIRHATIQALASKDYSDILKRIVQGGFRGGIVYDAIILKCAMKSKSTLNCHGECRRFCTIGHRRISSNRTYINHHLP